MPRYIDADLLKTDYYALPKSLSSSTVSTQQYVSLFQILNAPTADVVEVVRCKDCDNWKDENGREGLCQVWSDFENAHYRYTPKDGYCSEGERREE